MKRIILSAILFLLLSVIAYLVYLNEAIIPQKIKSTIIKELADATGKNVSLDSAKLDIFRGLIIKGLVISDGEAQIVKVKDINCRFLIIPILKKEIIVTSLRLNSPAILVERFPDDSINVVEMFFKKPLLLINGRFYLKIARIIIDRGQIDLKDGKIDPPFTKNIKNANLDIRFSLPDKMSFSADLNIPSKTSMLVKLSGDYRFFEKELVANIEARDFYPKEFERYAGIRNLIVPDGAMDLRAKTVMNEKYLDADIEISGMDLKFFQDNIAASINCAMSAKVKYDFNKKEVICRGEAAVKNLALSNLEFIDNIYDIRGKIDFSDQGFYFNNITATVLGIPVKGRAILEDLENPVLKIDVNSDIRLKELEGILKDRFNMNMPVRMDGSGALGLELKYKIPIKEPPALSGSLDMSGATLRIEYNKSPIENASGKVNFTQNQLTWSDFSFKYGGCEYTSSGVMTNFESPGLQLELNSDKLNLKTLLAFNNKIITISSLMGRTDDYDFSIQGELDTTDTEDPKADIKGSLKFDLSEQKEPFRKFKDKFGDLNPSGSITAEFGLKGSINDLLRCSIDANVKSRSLSLYGFKTEDLDMACSQRNGMLDIKRFHLSLYGGSMEGGGIVDLKTKDAPYRLNADIKNLKIEALKKDTSLKNNDISGTIQARFGVKGYSNDLARLNAWGRINILNGKLWQLNLLRGFGALLFKSDFSSVVFKEGLCNFFIRDRTIFTNDLMMKSDLLNIYGTVRIGFDNSINASLKAEFTDEGIDAANISDAAGAIERYSIVEVKGTLKEPEYKLRPDLSNVVSDIADKFFQP